MEDLEVWWERAPCRLPLVEDHHSILVDVKRPQVVRCQTCLLDCETDTKHNPGPRVCDPPSQHCSVVFVGSMQGCEMPEVFVGLLQCVLRLLVQTASMWPWSDQIFFHTCRPCTYCSRMVCNLPFLLGTQGEKVRRSGRSVFARKACMQRARTGSMPSRLRLAVRRA